MAPIPPEVAALLGPDPADRSGRGSGSVLAGNGHVAACHRPVDPLGFRLAVDAASVVWFFAYDVPELAGAPPWLAEHMVSIKAEAAHRVLG